MGFKCLVLILVLHQSTIQEMQFYKDSHRELSREGRGRIVRAKAGGLIEAGTTQEWGGLPRVESASNRPEKGTASSREVFDPMAF